MAVTVQTSPIARHLMLLSMSAGVLLLVLGPGRHWQQTLSQSQPASVPLKVAPVYT
ncbi:MAG: hypothetical protein HC805_02135, partial [Alkalinema sp. RL_2_19]|nr:hypothetical protein [Alkalinema sp. RL_2_19]